MDATNFPRTTMILDRRFFLCSSAAVSLSALLASRPAQAQNAAKFHPVNPPQPVDAVGKIEVTEFFWYGCPHCYAVEPQVEAWEKRLPADVVFRRIPAPLGQSWVPHAQAFYAFEVLGVREKLHRPFFDAIHKDRLRVDDRKAFEQWLGKQSVDPKKFEEAARSFGVQNNVRRASQQVIAYQINGVPTFTIQGKYLIGAEDAPTPQGLIAGVDQVIEMVRKELKAAAPTKADPGKAAARKGTK
jgi:thiol:disulfide interchange protein DsbA